MLHVSTLNPIHSCCGRCEQHSRLCWMLPTPSAEQKEKKRRWVDVTIAAMEYNYVLFKFSVYLCVMSTHGSITSEGASRVAVTGVWERVVFDLIIPRFHKLKDGSIAVNIRQTKRHCTGIVMMLQKVNIHDLKMATSLSKDAVCRIRPHNMKMCEHSWFLIPKTEDTGLNTGHFHFVRLYLA